MSAKQHTDDASTELENKSLAFDLLEEYAAQGLDTDFALTIAEMSENREEAFEEAEIYFV